MNYLPDFSIFPYHSTKKRGFIMTFQYYFPTNILFGPGTLAQLHQTGLPGSHALIVTTTGKSLKRLGYLDRLQEQLTAGGAVCTLCDKVSPNPTRDQVMEGAALAP